MDTVKAEIIKDSLKSIIRNSTWLLSIWFIYILSIKTDSSAIKILSIDLDYKTSSLFLITLSIVITLINFKNYYSIFTIYDSIEEEKENIKFYLNSYSQIMNPFSDPEKNDGTRWIDIMGFVFLCSIPLVGFLIGFCHLYICIDIILYILLLIVFVLFNFYPIIFHRKTAFKIFPKTYRIKKCISITLVLVFICIFISMVLFKFN